MKRGLDLRPEAARRRKPCSKIETKLRQRRNKCDKLERTLKNSPRNRRKENNSDKSSNSSRNSGSDNEISTRFLSSKQHVELEDFGSRRIVPVPRFRNLPENCGKRIESFSHPSKENLEGKSRNPNKSQSQTFMANEAINVHRSTTDAQICKSLNSRKTSKSFIVEESPRRSENDRKYHLSTRPSKIVASQVIIQNKDEESLKKRRSRSAPCTPLFKIKCAKDKCPRNLFVDKKLPVTEIEILEDIRKCRKNSSRGLRISKSGDVAVSSCKEMPIDERIIERTSLEDFVRQQEEIKALLVAEQLKPPQQDQIESFFLVENEKLLCNEANHSSTLSESKQSLQPKDNDSSSHLTNPQMHKNIEIELSSQLSNRQMLNREDIESTVSRVDETINQNDFQHTGKLDNREAIESQKESKLHDLLDPNKLNPNQEILKVESDNKIHQKDPNLVIQESEKVLKDISGLITSPRGKNDPEQFCSPRKPPKKRAFKWETILEKRHQTSFSRSPENRNEISNVATTIQEENKFDFWTEKDANCSKFCRCPRSRVRSFEGRKLEAYNAIRAALPKILMQRQAKQSGTEFESLRTKNWQQNSRNSANLRSSPERFQESIKRRQSRLSPRFMEHFAKRWEQCKFSTVANSAGFNNLERLNSRITKNVEETVNKQDLANHKTNCCDCQCNPKNNITSVTPVSPRHLEEFASSKKVAITSVLKQRKSPSPRRVTFRLPGRVIDEDREDEVNFPDNAINQEKKISEEWKESYAAENKKRDLKSEKMHERNCKNEDRRLSSSNAVAVTQILKNVENMRCISPAIREELNGNESDDSEQDWETPSGEYFYRDKEITFPKETREAMNILSRAKEIAARCHHSDHCQKRINRQDVFRQREQPHSRIDNSPEKKTTFVSSYAKALAKFQEGCDLNSPQSVCGTFSQRRQSRKPNETGGK